VLEKKSLIHVVFREVYAITNALSILLHMNLKAQQSPVKNFPLVFEETSGRKIPGLSQRHRFPIALS